MSYLGRGSSPAWAASLGPSPVVLVPVALALVIFLLQNIMVTALLLLVAAYLAGIYYYRPDRGYGYGIAPGGRGDWGGTGAGGSSRLEFYMLLVLCAMFSKDDGSWWIPGVLLVGCLLCLNVFSGGKVWGYEYF
jgi:hypothetical protein